MPKLFFILFALCAFACNSSGRPEPEPVASTVLKQVMPKDVFLQALQDAAVIIADSSASTPVRLMELFTALGEKYFIKLNKPGGREPVDTSCLYVYIDTAVKSACVLRIVVFPEQLNAGIPIEDFEKRFGTFKIDEPFPILTKQRLFPFVFIGAKKRSVCTIRVYPNNYMPKDDYRDLKINRIYLCYNT